MKKIELNGKKLTVYDGIEDMPIENFQKYNKFLLIDSGIGSDIADIDLHITRIAKFIKSGEGDRAIQELQNMRQNIRMVEYGISPKYLAFAALIHSVDGRELDDLSDDALKELLSELRRVKHRDIIDWLFQIKKKIDYELEVYFPSTFSNTADREQFEFLKKRVGLVLDEVVSDVDHSEEIDNIDTFLFKKYRPKSFLGQSSAEVLYDKQFEAITFILSQKANMDTKGMTVLRFYNAFENVKAQLDAEAKSLKRVKK